ncbi:hypothetical protein C0J52_19709 [Blattella germanica]|nr:hypothetical protein C0J52_19709 [Blattella germanica]
MHYLKEQMRIVQQMKIVQMATTNQQRAQCVFWYAKFESVKRVQREFERSCPNVNVWCGVSRNKVYRPFFFAEKTIRHETYLDMLQLFMLPQLEENDNMNIDYLKLKITQAFTQITPLMLQRNWPELHHRYKLC